MGADGQMQKVLLAAVDRNLAIGRNGSLLYRVPEDLRRFRRLTTGQVVLCGRKTLESFPNGGPLPNRETVLLSRRYEAREENPLLSVARTPEEALEKAELLCGGEKTLYVVGGESVYRLFAPVCETAYLTEIDAETPDADAFFPALRGRDGWVRAGSSPEQVSSSGLHFRYVTYRNESR